MTSDTFETGAPVRLLLVRHGQTTSNLTGLLDTAAPGAALTDLGQDQARALPAALTGERIDALFTSVLLRARQTIAPLADALGLAVHVRVGLREIEAGDLEMKNDKASVALYHEVSFAWADGDLERRMPGGENGHEVFGRFGAVIDEAVAGTDGTAVLVAHGQVIRSWVAAHAANVDVAYARKHPLVNGAVVVVEGSPAAGWQVAAWTGEPVGGTDEGDGSETGPGGEPA